MIPLLLGCATLPCPTDDLPDRVDFRDATHSFNSEWSVILTDGLLCARSADDPEWQLVGESGLPEGRKVEDGTPGALASVSADGCHLQALSSDGRFYRATDLRKSRLDLSWTDRWGWPSARGPGLFADFDSPAWSVSDSHPFDVDHYTDLWGRDHSVGMGVAHVYRLGPDGRRVHYNDWWLPADWSRQVCGPERGTFQAVSLSASASTLFVIDASGRMFTRLWDFDTAGENDLLTYSYVEDDDLAASTRALPAEPWVQQPEIEGELTSRVTIFQDGEGNDARVLRVEGRSGGETGYWEKRIADEGWDFVATGQPLEGELLPAAAPAPVEPDDQPLEGTLSREGTARVLELQVEDFNLFCSPARVHLLRDGVELTAGGEAVELQLHHVHRMLEEERAWDYWLDDEPALVRAALLLPADLDDPVARELLGDRAVLNLTGQATTHSLDLTEIDRSTWFGVPKDQKGRAGELFHLEAAVR